MRLNKKLTTLLSLIIVLICTTNVFAEISFRNGDFEDNFSNEVGFWTFNSYKDKGSYSVDTTNVHSGSASVLITNPEKTDSRIIQKVKLEPNSFYEITAWAKCENVGEEGYGANISAVNHNFLSDYLNGTTDWTKLKLRLRTDDQSRDLDISFGLGGYGYDEQGKAWFDDVEIKKVTAPANADDFILVKGSSKEEKNQEQSDSTALGIVLVIALLALITISIIYIVKKPKDEEETLPKSFNQLSKRRQEALTAVVEKTKEEKYSSFKLEWKDYLIMGITFIAYLCFTLTNLGDIDVPQKGYTSVEDGEICEISLNEPVSTSKMGLYLGYGVGKYRLQVKEGDEYTTIASYDKKEGEIFKWVFVDFPIKRIKDFRIVTEKAGGTINELAFMDVSNMPYNLSPASINVLDVSNETATALFDEQAFASNFKSYRNSTYFDEIYHARTAYENINELTVYEWTHPPLGKLIISIGIQLFGMNPFGWRCMGALFGALMLPLMYLFGLKIFRKRYYAIISMALFGSDFLFFTQSRISTIDVYVTFFIILMYYFMYDFFVYKSYNIGYKKSLAMLFCCGLAFGLGASSKWVGLYAGGGLAVLFFLSKYIEYRDYNIFLIKTEGRKIAWAKNFINENIIKTCGWCVAFFVAIPMIIYSLSYFPSYLDVPGNDASKILSNQESMFTYHSQTVKDSEHPYSSKWYQWPTDSKPILYYKETNIPKKTGYSSSIVAMGNPILYWSGLILLPLAIFFAIKRKNRGPLVLFVAMAFQFVPWIFVERTTYFYHFFSTVPFLVFAMVYALRCMFDDKKGGKVIITAFTVICVAMFAMFYPVLSGLEVPRTYVDNFLMWFKNKDIIKWHF